MDHARARTTLSLLMPLLLVCSLLLAACNTSSNTGQIPTRPTATPTPVPIDTSVADTTGCPPTGQSGQTLYAYSQRSIKDIYTDYRHPDTKDTPHPQYITAIDAQGKQAWQRQVANTAVYTWGFAAGNGAVFSQLNDRLSSYDGKDGTLRWSIQTINAQYLTLCNNLIYLEGNNGIEARSVHDGSLIWTHAGEFFTDSLQSSQSYQRVSHKAFVFTQMERVEDDRCPNKVCTSDSVYAVDAKTGRILWKHVFLTEGKPERYPANIAVSDQAVYVIMDAMGDDHALQIDKLSLGNGQILWNTTIHIPASSSLDLDYFYVDSGRIFVRDIGTVFVLDALNGKQIWTWSGPNDVWPFRGNVYGNYYGYDGLAACARDGSSGKQIWCLRSTESDSLLFEPPYAGNETTLYALSNPTPDDGNIIALNANSGKHLWTYKVLSTYDNASFKDATKIRALEVG